MKKKTVIRPVITNTYVITRKNKTNDDVRFMMTKTGKYNEDLVSFTKYLGWAEKINSMKEAQKILKTLKECMPEDTFEVKTMVNFYKD